MKILAFPFFCTKLHLQVASICNRDTRPWEDPTELAKVEDSPATPMKIAQVSLQHQAMIHKALQRDLGLASSGRCDERILDKGVRGRESNKGEKGSREEGGKGRRIW